MEAATPLRQPGVTTTGNRLTVHDLTVEDEAAARVVREREQAGDDPVKTVTDAIEIGARVLDREQAAANAEYVRTEVEKSAQELDRQFSHKARPFEEQVAGAVDAIALAQGDVAEAVGDQKGPTGKTGDVLVSIDAADGPCRGRIVFEAKNAKLSSPEARRELSRGMRERDADFAVLVVPAEEKVPAKLTQLREYEGDKLVAAYDPEDGSTLALELGYRLARARLLMERAAA